MNDDKVAEPSKNRSYETIALKKILLATDGSEDASVATRAAVDLSNSSSSELHVVHVFEFIPPREYINLALRIRSPFASEREGREMLAEQVSLIEETGSIVHAAHLRMGSPVDEILNTAQEIGADLVVVGSRGLGGVKRLLMGSVSERVVHYATCPVLVLRSAEAVWPPSHVIVADDGSTNALQAGTLGAKIGGLVGANATLVQVYPRALESLRTTDSPESDLVNEELGRARELLLERADKLASPLEHYPGVQLLADEGSETIDGIAMTLLDTAREMDEATLLAVGSRGMSLVDRMRMGSVSTKVVRGAVGPVLVCPPQPDLAEPSEHKGVAATTMPDEQTDTKDRQRN